MSLKERIESNKCLKALSTFGIGGRARHFIAIQTVEEMQELMPWIAEESLPFWVVGKGSNSLFDDRGFDGLVVLNKIDFTEFEKGRLKVGAGTSFSLLGMKTAKKGWSGLEFASGIPGSVGGAIYMNAGANGMETSDCLVSVSTVDRSGALKTREASELTFSYRHSTFQGGNEIIVEGEFQLEKREGAREEQLSALDYRMATQPYGEKSAGCIFRNPDGGSAGALIEQCGLKGLQVGGAKVSLKHANFIVNTGNATAGDVLKLIEQLKMVIMEQTGHALEMEVRPVPYRGGACVPR